MLDKLRTLYFISKESVWEAWDMLKGISSIAWGWLIHGNEDFKDWLKYLGDKDKY